MSPEVTSGYVLGVDVGGTFTDAALIDTASGELRRAKVSTTPDDQSRGTLATIPELGIETSDLDVFCHGTTVGINAFLQRRGAKMGLLCTEGTRDMLDAGRFQREPASIYQPDWIRPHQARPVVERRYIREVGARVLYDGSTYIELDEDAVRREIEFLRDEGVESVAVCLLNSYMTLEHENRVVALIREVMPDAYVQHSAVRPVIGEYARTSATVIDAYTGPVVSRYLRRLDGKLRDAGHDGPAVIIQMNGGVRTLERTVEDFPAYTLSSGPVGGMLGAEYYGRNFVGVDNLVCFDIGGTSTDLGLVVEGSAETVDEWEVEWALPLGMPAVDVRSIGAGGGSLIQADAMGTLRVGPESAGADPGPAAYGRGGTLPTVTDAHIVLGSLRPETFLGGRMTLDVEAAHHVIGELAERLVMEPAALASGALQLMNASIETEIAKMVFERGVDMREFSLFAYGGAGALHAAEVARAAGIAEVIVPQMAGGFSALGLATAPPKVERAVSHVEDLEVIGVDRLVGLLTALQDEITADLVAQGVAADDIEFTRSLNGMYSGQSFSNQLAFDAWPLTPEVVARWRAGFDEMYDRLYGYSAPELAVTVTTLSVVGTGPRRALRLPELAEGGAEPPGDALAGRNELRLGGGDPEEVSFYAREALLAGNRIAGPAVIEDEMTTIVVPSGAEAVVDRHGNVRIAVR